MRRRAVLTDGAALAEVATIWADPIRRASTGRLLVGVDAVLGAALLTAPEALLSRLLRDRVDGTVRSFARVLGARLLAQAALLERHPGPRRLLAGAAVDATHAASMVVLAALRPGLRRLALTSAVAAGGLAVCGACEARRAGRTHGGR